jgi:hypothetical protein
MFNFARETSKTIQVGRKRKHGSRIPVQATAKTRRRFQNPGTGIAAYERKEKVVKDRGLDGL